MTIPFPLSGLRIANLVFKDLRMRMRLLSI